MRISTLATSLVVAAVCFIPIGCSKSPPKQPPSVLPVKLWVVLGSLPTEQVGRRENRGCRLTQVEILTYLNALRKNSAIYGTSVTFLPEFDGNGQIVIINPDT